MNNVKKFLIAVLFAVFAFILFVGCSVVPDSVEKAVKRMEKQGYNVTVEEPMPDYTKYGAHTILYIEEKEDPQNTLVALRFNNEGQAEGFYNAHTEYKDNNEVFRQEEEWVFWGTKEAEYDFTY